MIVSDLINIILRLEMGGKESNSEIAFDAGRDVVSPFGITGVGLDKDGDINLVSDERAGRTLSPAEIKEALSAYDSEAIVYFSSVDAEGKTIYYNIKDGGTFEIDDPELYRIPAGVLADHLRAFDGSKTLRFESGTINFTINSIYHDESGRLCLESNEIEELDNYPICMVVEELEKENPGTLVYFYDDDAQEYYGIYASESRIDSDGEIWIKVR